MRPLLLALALAAAPAVAGDPQPAAKSPPAKADKAEKKLKGKKTALPSFQMPDFGEIPKADGAKGAQRDSLGTDTRAASTDAAYTVVRVQHAKQFSMTSQGASAIRPLEVVAVKGSPPTTEKFSSAVRVKSPQKAGAGIEVVLLDPRGDTALSASGQISFSATGGDETEWLVDWDPSTVRSGGEYKVLVRIDGQPMGSWPLKLEIR